MAAVGVGDEMSSGVLYARAGHTGAVFLGAKRRGKSRAFCSDAIVHRKGFSLVDGVEGKDSKPGVAIHPPGLGLAIRVARM